MAVAFKNFNSTMVRLKERWGGDHACRRTFQFHYGTIKRGRGFIPGRVDIEFQFHYGTIKRGSQRLCARFFCISIPLWYD